MRIFASERVKNMMQALGMGEGEAIEHRMVSNAIEKAQRKVEGHNFDIRKQLLEYDDVANDQRRVIYQQRDELMESEDVSELIESVREAVVNEVVTDFIAPQSLEEQWDIQGLEQQIKSEFSLGVPIQAWLDEDDELDEDSLRVKILDEILAAYTVKEAQVGVDILRRVEKQVMLETLDKLWKDHLATMDHLRQGIHLRGYAAKDPKQEYKREAFNLFQEMLTSIKHDVIRVLSHIQFYQESDLEILERKRQKALEVEMQLQHEQSSALQETEENSPDTHTPFVRDGVKVGRNDSCPCGSGKKFKRCHGSLSKTV